MSYKLLFRTFNGILGIITLYSFVHTFLVPPPVPLFVRVAGPGGLFLGGTIGLLSAISPLTLYKLYSDSKIGKILRILVVAFVIYMIGTVEIYFAPRNTLGILSGILSSLSFAVLIPLVVFYYDKIDKKLVYTMIGIIIILLAFSLPRLNSLAQLLGPAGPPGLYFTGGLLFHMYFEHTYTLVFASATALKPRILKALSRVREAIKL